jgi:uncharacterized protein YcbX
MTGVTNQDGAVGVVAELWRYPVKSMQGERLQSAELGPSGLAGDRRYGLIGAGGRLLSAKSVPELFSAGARTEGNRVVITLPDGTDVLADDADASALLSRWLGREVELRETGSGAVSYELTFDPPNDDAEMVSWPAMADSFLDLAPVNALTTASLARMAAVAPDTAWDVRRFRPNVLVDTGSVEGFVEDGWVGGDVALGDGGAALHVDMASVRCAMPLRAQPAWAGAPALERDIAVFKALTDEHNYHLGIYCGVASAGTVTVGDPVRPTP